MSLEKINNSIVSDKYQRQKEREDKERVKTRLFNYFYNTFKKYPHSYEENFERFQYIYEREKVINKISQSDSLTFQYINSIYTKTLKEVYNIFKNNYNYIEKQEKLEEFQNLANILQKIQVIKQEQQKQERILKEKKEKEEKESKIKQERKNFIFNIFQYAFSLPRIIYNFYNLLFISLFYWIFCLIKYKKKPKKLLFCCLFCNALESILSHFVSY